MLNEEEKQHQGELKQVEDRKEMERPWFDLPTELIEVTMRKLFYVDQVFMRAVWLRDGHTFESNILESTGELLLVFNERGDHRSDLFVCIYKLNSEGTGWDEVNDLGERRLFLGPTSFSVSKSGISSWIYQCSQPYPYLYSSFGCRAERITPIADDPYSLARKRSFGADFGLTWIEPPPL
ncbi:hypothetical protein GIB67_011164 [Kingdonia uniflora]|uniref:KIB1-4 beta-propeller domain-containing protein n=1 Tax=Kingdonia uniflora TaxID=39325 RepID=A0A7J7PA82_9MAGN|nr:hypothetical protein GIB67_011164 [Kingdonia uniflora]